LSKKIQKFKSSTQFGFFNFALDSVVGAQHWADPSLKTLLPQRDLDFEEKNG